MNGPTGELFAALAKAQGAFKGADKDAVNPHFRSKYPTLASVIEATQEALTANQLCIIQMPINVGENIGVTTVLGHASGQSIESTIYVAPAQFTAQAVGSVVTYLRRYARMAILGIAPEDDDGEAAIAKPAPQTMPNQMRGTISNPPSAKIRQQVIDAKDRIKRAIDVAKLPETIDEIFALNQRDLDLIAEVQQSLWTALMQHGANRKMALTASFDPDEPPINL